MAARSVRRLQQSWRRSLAMGKREEALADYQQGLAIAQQLADSDKGNAQSQRDLAFSYDNIGDALADADQNEQALAAYRKSLAIRQQLAERDGGNVVWQRDLSGSYTKIGDVLAAAGRPEEALAEYRKSLA